MPKSSASFFSPALVQLDEVQLLARGELGLAAAELAGGACDLESFAGAHADQVGLGLGDHRQDVEEESTDGVGRVMDRAAEAQLHLAGRELVDDVARVGARPCETVELRNDEHVAGPAGRESFPEAGPRAVGAGQAMVNVDPFGLDPERLDRVSLRGQSLRRG